MCIIAVKPAGVKMFPEEQIRYMFSQNPDGAGLAYAKDGIVHLKKGFMKVEDLLSYLDEHKFKNVPLILHFRIGTSGEKDDLNCHPYPVFGSNKVSGKSSLVMAHNGILHNFNPPVGAKYNDTQNFIKKCLSKLPKDFLDNGCIRNLIDESIGSNRLAFLDGDGKITKFGVWWDEDGYSYSNSGYKKPVFHNPYLNYDWGYHSPTKTTTSKKEEDECVPYGQTHLFKTGVEEKDIDSFCSRLEKAADAVGYQKLTSSEYNSFYEQCEFFAIQMDEDYFVYEEKQAVINSNNSTEEYTASYYIEFDQIGGSIQVSKELFDADGNTVF